MVTLHHFVHPNWFETLGGFTKEANIPIFVEFAKTAFRSSRFYLTDILMHDILNWLPRAASSGVA